MGLSASPEQWLSSVHPVISKFNIKVVVVLQSNAFSIIKMKENKKSCHNYAGNEIIFHN